MLTLQHVTTLFGGSLAAGARVTDFAVLATASGTYLYAGAQPGMGILGFRLTAGSPATYAGAVQYPAGTPAFGPTRLDVLSAHDGSTVLLPTARFAGEIGGPTLFSDGSFGPQRSFSDRSGPGGSLVDLELVRIGADIWIYGTRTNGAGIDVWRYTPTSAYLQVMPSVADDASSHLAGISAMATAVSSGTTWILVASASEHGVSAMTVGSDGRLALAGSIGAEDGLGIAAPSAIEAVTLAGTTYAVVAGSGSSSLSVLRIDPAGLVPTDHVTDSLDTRFQSVGAIESVVLDGRAWVFAGGADDGLSVFQLLPDGRLVHVARLEDTGSTSLADVRSIRAAVVGGEIQLFVASGTENGISQFAFVPGPAGLTLAGTGGADTLTGGGGEDVIHGGGGNDRLSGGSGDDILIDGAGSDTLTGGAGGDLFVLIADGERDVIADFDPARDRIDLSDYPLLYSLAQVSVTPTATGALLVYGDETVEIVTAGQTPLMPGDLSTPMILNLPRSPVAAILQGRVAAGTPGDDTLRGTVFSDSLSGGAGADSLWGGLLDDTLDGGAGPDTLDGGEGRDTASYATAQGTVRADLAGLIAGAGDAAGDVFLFVENLVGSAFADELYGDTGANSLVGGGGDDLLFGRGGDDTLDGGDGNDRLVGGAGADLLAGGAGTDTADYSGATAAVVLDLGAGGTGGDAAGDRFAGVENVTGTAFGDRITGDAGGNLIAGLDGDDLLFGAVGDDTILGGAGRDRIDGGPGFDWASYAGATARVTVDMVTPSNSTGWAAGDTFVSIEALLGSDHADDLRGDGASNVLSGGAGADWLMGRGGNDSLFGGDGNDNLIGGAGADRLDGGEGIDRAVYTDATSGVVVDLLIPGRNTGIAAGDVLLSIEALRGSDHADELWGDDFDNQFDAGFGNDTVAGRGGSDWLVGRAGNDVLDGMDGNDLLFGGPGADVLIGGAGTDRAHYGDSPYGLVADLKSPARNTGYAAGDSYSGIENLQGSVGNDTLAGDDFDNVVNGARGNDLIEGRGGADFLIGADGDDVLDGGAGADLLHGGAGRDSFVFLRGSGADRILDFTPGADRILLGSDLAGVHAGDPAGLVATYAASSGGGTFFDFGTGDTLFVKGIADPALLLADIHFL